MKLSNSEIKHREEILDKAIKEFGADTVSKWMKDKSTMSIINTMCHLDCVSKPATNETLTQ